MTYVKPLRVYKVQVSLPPSLSSLFFPSSFSFFSFSSSSSLRPLQTYESVPKPNKVLLHFNTTMSLQIVSDLHLESPEAYNTFQIITRAHSLVLLGDIGCVADAGYLFFLGGMLLRFRRVFHVLGVHEPYGSSWKATKDLLSTFQRQNRMERDSHPDSPVGEYILLDRTEYELPDQNVTILGCTLFTHAPVNSQSKVRWALNEYYRIRGWTIQKNNNTHREDLEWLNERVRTISKEQPDRRIVVLTHHCPTVDPRAVDPCCANSPLAAGFATDLRGRECWENRNVALWAFGRTHYNCNFTDERTEKQVYANQRGYHHAPADGFKMWFCVPLSKPVANRDQLSLPQPRDSDSEQNKTPPRTRLDKLLCKPTMTREIRL